MDICLQLGLSSSCMIFARFDGAREDRAKETGVYCIAYVFDDFIIIHICPFTCGREFKAFYQRVLT